MPLHMADLGTDTMQQELDASNATRVSRELAEIDAALERLYQTPKKFGICEDTGKPIPLARLRSDPVGAHLRGLGEMTERDAEERAMSDPAEATRPIRIQSVSTAPRRRLRSMKLVL